MTRLITQFFEQIETMPSIIGVQGLDKVVRDWCARTEVWIIREALLQWLKESANLEQVRDSARETSTHYVWPVYTTASGYRVIKNEFKPPGQMTAGWATTLHNHRYSFTSLMLSGRYQQVRYDVSIQGYEQVAELKEIGSDSAIEGSVIAISHDIFHRLTDIENRTMTLVVRCPAVKEASVSVDTRTLKASRHLPVEARIVQLMDALATTEDAG